MACSEGRPFQGQAPRISWREEIGPLFAARCAGCHAGGAPAGGYDATTYLSAVKAGEGGSLLLQALADATHASVADVQPVVRAWVVEGRLSYFRSPVHAGGILNPADPSEFHGAVLRARSWDFAFCAGCHGGDFAGGAAGASCLACHAQGPTSCDTCHGAPPQSGAHLRHGGDCSACHPVPAAWDAPGHILAADGKPKQGAVVAFDARAAREGPGRAGPPAWDGATCSNIYCHGGAFADSAAGDRRPAWSGGPMGCSSCHGAPPASHAPDGPACAVCHLAAVHLDGVVQVGAQCSDCHGSAESPAPPRDLAGNTDPSAIGVGAHQAHLGAHAYSGPVECSACHAPVAQVDSPGHIDHALPAAVSFSGLAVADGAAPRWDRATATCSATYCHGGGAAPSWTGGGAQVFCGACHGLPPANLDHQGVGSLADCVLCHASSVDAAGAIVFTAPGVTTHLNGSADVGR